MGARAATAKTRTSPTESAQRTDAPRVEPTDRERRLGQVGDVNASAHDPAHEASLQHAARAMLIAIHRDRRALRQRGCVRRPKACHKLGGQVDVDDARDPEAAEESAATLGTPDEAGADDRSGLDLLVGPDLHLRTDPRVIVHDRVIADDASLFEDHP